MTKTILVVEDQEDVRITATLMLKRLGYDVQEAGSGAEALDILFDLGESITLVFSDILMPGGLNGFELSYAVNDRWPNIKILLTSGHIPDDLASESGVVATEFRVLQKPYRMADLSQALSGALVVSSHEIVHSIHF